SEVRTNDETRMTNDEADFVIRASSFVIDSDFWLRLSDFRSEQLQVRQIALTHQELIHPMGGAAAFADGPDDEALPATDIPRREDAGDAGHVVLVDHHVAAGVELQAQLADGAFGLGAEEAQRQEAQVAIELELRAGDFFE